MARTATLSRSVALFRAFLRRAERPGSLLRRPGRRLGRSSSPSRSPSTGSTRPRRRRRAGVLRRRVPRGRRDVRRAGARRRRDGGPRGRRSRERCGPAVRRCRCARRGRRLLLVERPGARPPAVDHGRRDGACDQAGRHGLPVVHALVVAVGRARDRAVALPRRLPRRAAGIVRRTGREPKNRFGESLFPVSVGAALRWARRCPDADVVAACPRYHPWWARWVVRVAGAARGRVLEHRAGPPAQAAEERPCASAGTAPYRSFSDTCRRREVEDRAPDTARYHSVAERDTPRYQARLAPYLPTSNVSRRDAAGVVAPRRSWTCADGLSGWA